MIEYVCLCICMLSSSQCQKSLFMLDFFLTESIFLNLSKLISKKLCHMSNLIVKQRSKILFVNI
jgi:hypothetical protein